MSADVRLPHALERLRIPSLGGGIALMLLGLVLSFTIGDKFETFMHGYLYGYMLVGGIAIGSIALLCIHHMTSGAWSFVLQRIFEANTRTLWIVAIGLIPILLGPLMGLHNMYSAWMVPDGQFAEVIQNKERVLNKTVWALTTVGIMAIWLGMMTLLNKWSKDMDTTGDGLIVLKFRRFCPPALLVYCLTMTYATLNLVMSLSPEYFSTIYGPLHWISQGLTILAFSILILSYVQDEKPLSRCVQAEHYHHIGNLMLAFTVLWAYMSFSQYLITWAASLPEEISYYIDRRTDGFIVLGLILMFGHFLFPLIWLLFRRNKLNLRPLRTICYWILVMRMFDMFWQVNPSIPRETPGMYFSEVLISVVVLLGMAGIWFFFFLGELTKRPLLSLNDPRLYDAVAYQGEHGEALEHA